MTWRRWRIEEHVLNAPNRVHRGYGFLTGWQAKRYARRRVLNEWVAFKEHDRESFAAALRGGWQR